MHKCTMCIHAESSHVFLQRRSEPYCTRNLLLILKTYVPKLGNMMIDTRFLVLISVFVRCAVRNSLLKGSGMKLSLLCVCTGSFIFTKNGDFSFLFSYSGAGILHQISHSLLFLPIILSCSFATFLTFL